MNASVIIVTNPFEPIASRSVHAIEPGLTVGALLLDCGIAEESWATGPEIRIGTDMVPADVYALRVIGDGDIVTVIRWPMGGGGGGGGGKNPLRTVLTIAVLVASIYLGPMAAVAMGRTFRDHPERRRWAKVEMPQEGDCVLLRRSRHPIHVGVWLDVDDGGVLHCAEDCGVVFQRPDALRLNGWAVEGFYRFSP